MGEEPQQSIRTPFISKVWLVVWLAFRKYVQTDGEQRAASFAYYALFALFPLLVLFVTIGSQFVNKHEASARIIQFIDHYIPLDAEGESKVLTTVTEVVNSRKPVGLFAVVAVLWGSLGFFHALVRGVNRAWGTLEYPWYRLPFKNLAMIGIVASALFIGVVAPTVLQTVEKYLYTQSTPINASYIYYAFRYAERLLPWLVLFHAFTMFYKFAPRQHRQFGQVWLGALFVTMALQGMRSLVVLYAQNIINFNKLYGAFGGVIALLMWIYLTGSVIILGGCLSAAQAEIAAPDDERHEATPEA